MMDLTVLEVTGTTPLRNENAVAGKIQISQGSEVKAHGISRGSGRTVTAVSGVLVGRYL